MYWYIWIKINTFVSTQTLVFLKIKVGTNTLAQPLKHLIFYPTAKCHMYVLHNYSRSMIFELKAHVSHGLPLLTGTRLIILPCPYPIQILPHLSNLCVLSWLSNTCLRRQEQSIWPFSINPLLPNAIYSHNAVWCSKHWKMHIADDLSWS